jgi:hypothetical protein
MDAGYGLSFLKVLSRPVGRGMKREQTGNGGMTLQVTYYQGDACLFPLKAGKGEW